MSIQRCGSIRRFQSANDGIRAQIFEHVLFPDEPEGIVTARGIADRHAEQRLEHEETLGMVADRPVTGVRNDQLRLIEPLVEREIILADIAHFRAEDSAQR